MWWLVREPGGPETMMIPAASTVVAWQLAQSG
jgi:hypothetical protein